RHTRWPRDWSSDVCSSDLRSTCWCRADILAERHQQVVVDHPIAARQFASQHLLALFGGLSPDVAPAVADAVNMDIHADPRFPKQIGRASCRERVLISGVYG